MFLTPQHNTYKYGKEFVIDLPTTGVHFPLSGYIFPYYRGTLSSVRPRSSVGRVTVDLIGGRGFHSHRGKTNLFFTSCGSLIPFTRANAQWVFHGLHIAL